MELKIEAPEETRRKKEHRRDKMSKMFLHRNYSDITKPNPTYMLHMSERMHMEQTSFSV
jgi:hypothetical protein